MMLYMSVYRVPNNMLVTYPYGQKFSKSAHDRRVFYAISANFDADRRKKMTILKIVYDCVIQQSKLACLRQ